MPGLTQKIGRGLLAFGEGSAGRGQQFLQGLDDNRKQALLDDAFTVQQQLTAGDVSGARGTLLDRLRAIEQLGGNPADTDALLLKIEQNDLGGALADVNTVVDFGISQGHLKAPVAAPGQTTTLTEAEATAAGFRPGSVVQRGPAGKLSVAQKPLAPAKPTKGFSTLTAAELEVAGLPPGTFAQRDGPSGRIVDISLPDAGAADVIQVTPEGIRAAGFPAGTFAQKKPDGTLINIRPPTKEGTDLKAFSTMGGENRIKLGLIANANQLMSQAQNALFDEKGKHRGVAQSLPGSAARIAREDLRESLQSMLRAVSGAAIPEEEIQREVDSMLPALTDFNDTANAKWARAKKKIRNLHTALTGGFTGIPNELLLQDAPFSTVPGAGGGLPEGFDQLSPEDQQTIRQHLGVQ